MTIKVPTENGIITIDNEVISKIAGIAATDCYGIVGMAAKSIKDGIVHLLKMDSISKGVRIDCSGGIISIELHIIVEYGTNIPVICETLAQNVQYQVEEYTGIKVKAVNIFVEGVRVDA